MIRKPDARDFRESGTVTTMRDAHAVAIEGARGIGQGTAQFVTRGVMLLFGFGFVMSVVGHAGPTGLLFAFAGIFVLVVLRRGKRDRNDRSRWDTGSAQPRLDAATIVAESYALSPGAAGRAAAKAAVPAILLFPTSAIGYMLPFAIGSVLYLSLAMLLLARLAGDRTILRYDRESITVSGLIRQNTILWDDVADIEIRKSFFLNVRVLFTSGATRNLVVEGSRNRLGGARTLYVPVNLLALEEPALAALISRFLHLQGRGQAPSPIVAADRIARPKSARQALIFEHDGAVASYMPDRGETSIAVSTGPSNNRPIFGRKRA